MKPKRTFYPSRIFDDALEALVILFVAKGWLFPGIDVAQLQADVAAQRARRIEHDTLHSQYLALQETFGLEQLARYRRFIRALNAARGAFCEDKAVMAELDRFTLKRSGRPRKSPEESEAA